MLETSTVNKQEALFSESDAALAFKCKVWYIAYACRHIFHLHFCQIQFQHYEYDSPRQNKNENSSWL